MSEQSTSTTTVEPPSGADQPDQAQGEQRVPYDRFKQVNDQLAASRTELEELRAWKEQQEQAQLSEIERAQAAASAATARAEAAEAKATAMERTALVVDAARAAGFADPRDAALAVDLGGVGDADAAKAAVEQLAKDKPHWLATAGQQTQPTTFGTVSRQEKSSDVPVGDDGKPDHALGLGRELMNGLFGR